MSPLISILALGLLAAPEPSPNMPLLLEGNSEDDITYYLIRKKDKKPLLSVDGSPLYEGIRTDPKDPFRAILSYRALKAGGYLKDDSESGKTLPWLEKSLGVSLGKEDFAGLLNYFQKNPKDFRNFFSGSSEAKANLLFDLLSKPKMTITSDDLKDLQRSAFEPEPQPLVITISIEEADDWFRRLKWVWEPLIKIHADKLKFDFAEKNIVFVPEKNLIRLQLIAKKISMEGPLERVGRPRSVHRYMKDPNWYYERQYLEMGEVEGAILNIGIQLQKDSRGYWRLHLLEPVQLKMTALVPKVKLKISKNKETEDVTDDFKEERTVELNEKSVKLIETKIAEAVEGAMSTLLYPRSLGMSFEWNDLESSEKRIGLQTKLMDFQVTSDGIQMLYGSRLNLKKPSHCIDSDEVPELHSSGSVTKRRGKGKPWTINATYPQQVAWKVAGSKEKPRLRAEKLQLEMLSEFIEQTHQASYLAGLYCVSTRTWKNRPASIPWVEFQPRKINKLVRSDNGFSIPFEATMQSYFRDGEDIGEKFRLRPESSAVLDYGAKISFDSEAKKIEFEAPTELKFSDFDDQENEFFKNLKRIILQSQALFQGKKDTPMLGGIIRGESDEEKVDEQKDSLKWQMNFEDLGALINTPEFIFKDLLIGEDRFYIDAFLDYKIFSKDLKLKRAEARKKVMPDPVTLLTKKKVEFVTNPYITFDWSASNPELYFSWRLLSSNDKTPAEWSPFDKEMSESFHLKKSGKYEFQIKAMNQYFKIEHEPQTFEFYYEEEVVEEAHQDKQAEWVVPEAPQKTVTKPVINPTVTRAKAKGAFGCSASANSSEKIPFGLALLLCILLLNIFRSKKTSLNFLRIAK
jgi:hypothetical protein